MEAIQDGLACIDFDRFRVQPRQRRLLAGGAPIEIGSRTFDLLLALIEARGELVGKDALMRRVWPGRIVEENNLQTHISALRKALGSDRDLIRTVAGRGYQFVGEIRTRSTGQCGQVSPAVTAADLATARPPTNLPSLVSELIGRDTEIEEVLGFVAGHRLVTLTGAGGIGKTQLGLAVARQLLPEFTDGVRVVELSHLSEPGLVPVTVAAALGLEIPADEVSSERVARALSAKRLLLVLDTCEHVIDAAAMLAEAFLRANPAARVIATSREPLRAEGEFVYRVRPLSVPAEDIEDTIDPVQSSAVLLFLARAQATHPQFPSDRRAAETIAAICRKLDCLPLAIELAAAQAAALGTEQLAAHLADLFHLLTRGRRTALPRHQTIRATLDWSYRLLSDLERMILHRLAIFPGAFTLEAAGAILAGVEITASEVIEGLADLVAKSLVVADLDGNVASYRLLHLTRAYAQQKLTETGEFELVVGRYADYCRDGSEPTEGESAEWLTAESSTDDRHQDASVGAMLTRPVRTQLWMEEVPQARLAGALGCRHRIEPGLATGSAPARRTGSIGDLDQRRRA
jgi:predicted ATPase/DNA-binding winged helix-turn-helix (wHTH) protein